MAGLKGKTVLVTGGTGFIGGHLVEKLHTLEANVIVSDICLNPHSYFIINGLHRKTSFEVSDIRGQEDVYNLYSKHKPDFVVHLAAQTIVTDAYLNPVETLETNINGTINILEVSKKFPSINTIIVASSDKAYGKTEKPYNESFPLKGDHPYDVSKSAADLICSAYYKTYETPVVITRFGNVYGEGDLHYDRIVPGICKAIIKNKPFQIRSNGKYIRDYLYIDDVVNGYIILLQQGSKVHGEAYNLSSNDNLSVLDMIKMVRGTLGVPLDYSILNTAKNEIPYQHLNDAKIRKLGFKNKYTFKNSIKGIFDWYSEYMSE